MASSSRGQTALDGYPGAGAGPRSSALTLTLTGATLGLATVVAGPYLSFRPNRIMDGVSASGVEALGWAAWAVAGLWLLAGVLVAVPALRRFAIARAFVATSALTLALTGSGRAALAYAAAEGGVARTSFGAAFWVGLFGCFLVLYAAASETRSRAGRAVVWVAPLAALAALAALGLLSELGIAREWAFTKDTFAREFRRHMAYAFGATLGAITLGVPFGIASARNRGVEAAVMGALNLGQVFPALAFVGIMMPILGSLGRAVPPLGAIGVAGIGWAPVAIVLLVYALFPVTRNTLVAIRHLDPAVVDAARGMGMGRWRLLAEVELPLAFPVVLAGVRVALVQSTAGAIVAAFVGGGGLGATMFFGLEQTSMDLVLLGIVPIVALALIFDAGLRAIEVLSGGVGVEPA